MLETIYITRHGFRGNWANTKWSPSPTGIDADPALASHGVEQSIELAQHLQSIEPKIERIYCSPFYRCLQTIQYTAKALELPIMVDHGIGEWYGITRDTHPSPAGLPMLQGFFPEIDTEYKASLVPSNKGETMADIHNRVARAIKIIIADAEAHGCRAIVLCTHAATNVTLLLGLVLTSRLLSAVH